MNERIRKLAEQAGITTNLDTDFFVKNDLNAWLDYFTQKFGELLVKECIERARSVGDLRGVNDDMVYGADYAALQISKHFGVE